MPVTENPMIYLALRMVMQRKTGQFPMLALTEVEKLLGKEELLATILRSSSLSECLLGDTTLLLRSGDRAMISCRVVNVISFLDVPIGLLASHGSHFLFKRHLILTVIAFLAVTI